MISWVAIGLMIASTVVGAFGALFLKQGASGFSVRAILDLSVLRQHRIIVGALLYVVGMLLYLLVLRTVPLSAAYPLTSLSYLWIIVLSKFYLDERIDAWRWAGIILIIAGIVLISLA